MPLNSHLITKPQDSSGNITSLVKKIQIGGNQSFGHGVIGVFSPKLYLHIEQNHHRVAGSRRGRADEYTSNILVCRSANAAPNTTTFGECRTNRPTPQPAAAPFIHPAGHKDFSSATDRNLLTNICHLLHHQWKGDVLLSHLHQRFCVFPMSRDHEGSVSPRRGSCGRTSNWAVSGWLTGD